MTAEASADVKEVIFLNQDVFNDYKALPPDVWDAANARTTILQNGGRLPVSQVKALKGGLAGISEIRLQGDKDTYRVYFAAEFKTAIYMLDAGIKKSPTGDEIPRPQIERLEERLKQAKKHYAAAEKILEARFKDREDVRKARAAALKTVSGNRSK